MKLQEFSFGNFRSFKDINTLNLAPANVKSKNKNMDISNIISCEKQSFLKSKAIYGANASGKSNIIRALIVFLRIIDECVQNKDILILTESFRLSTETENEPTFFQMIFWLDNIKYRYGFETTDKEITAEWLFATPKKRELPYFIRENQQIIHLDKTNFKEAYKLTLLADNEEIFRDNSLFLSTLAKFGIAKLSKKLVEEITSIRIINGLGRDGMMFDEAQQALQYNNEKQYMLNLLKVADIGIDDIIQYEFSSNNIPETVEENIKETIKDTKMLFSIKNKFDENNNEIDIAPMPFKRCESEGTIKLFELSPYIYHTLKTQGVLIIDEFDARFHSLLTKKIVELFNSEGNQSAQLIFTTHDTNLLDAELLRRDQIEFVEKDKYGASHLYSLVEFKGSRKNNLFEKNYIQGKYGAIPFLSNFKELLHDVE